MREKKKIILGVAICILILVVTILAKYIKNKEAISNVKQYYQNKQYISAYYELNDVWDTGSLGNLPEKINILHELSLIKDNAETNDDLMSVIVTGMTYYDKAEELVMTKEVDEIMYETAQTLANSGCSVEGLFRNYISDDKNIGVDLINTMDSKHVEDLLKQVSNSIDREEADEKSRELELNNYIEKMQKEEQAKSEFNNANPLSITEHDVHNDGDYTYCTGTVSNVGDMTYSYVKVRVTYYDASESVLTTDWTYAVGSEGIRTNENQQFELMTKVDGTVSGYRVEIQEYQ